MLDKVAMLLKQAAEEIKQLKAENEKLRQEISELKKTASFKEEEGFLNFGEVSNEDVPDLSENPIEKLKSMLGQ